jgi:hypothetical protein
MAIAIRALIAIVCLVLLLAAWPLLSALATTILEFLIHDAFKNIG